MGVTPVSAPLSPDEALAEMTELNQAVAALKRRRELAQTMGAEDDGSDEGQVH